MIKINRKIEYALMALKLMDQRGPGELTTGREVCETFHTPSDTTAKVMQAMGRAGILSSVQGIKGGYTLKKDLNTLTFLELSEVLEGKQYIVSCSMSTEQCELNEYCNIQTPMRNLNHKLLSFFSSISVRDLFQLPETSQLENGGFIPFQEARK